ncbi:MAG: hypothetical protein RL616_2031, partial [Verrucomicrobiota bacterium]
MQNRKKAVSPIAIDGRLISFRWLWSFTMPEKPGPPFGNLSTEMKMPTAAAIISVASLVGF